MSDVPQGPRWWRAPDGKWYPPEKVPADAMPSATQLVPPSRSGAATYPWAVPPTAAEDLSLYRGLPSGWYQDATNPALARYWDGAALSHERRAVVPRPDAATDEIEQTASSPADSPCGPLWPEDVELQRDLTPISSIQPRFLDWGIGIGTPVASIAPLGYPAYVRILHPARQGAPAAHTTAWREVAAWSQRAYYPLMQFERVSMPRFVPTTPPPFDTVPTEGRLDADQCHVLYAQLARWTNTPHTCWLGLWEGQESLATPMRSPRWVQTDGVIRWAARFDQGGRRYLLAKAAATSIATLGRPPLSVTVNLAWPDDRAWYAVTDIDFDSTLVATSEECAAVLLADHRLEALPVHALDRLDIDGDVLNAQADAPR